MDTIHKSKELGNVPSGTAGYRTSFTCQTSCREHHLWSPPLLVKMPSSAPASLKRILVGCKIILTWGRYTWQHNKALKCLAAELQTKRVTTNTMPFKTLDKFPQSILFVREREKQVSSRLPPVSSALHGGRELEMQAYLNQQLIFIWDCSNRLPVSAFHRTLTTSTTRLLQEFGIKKVVKEAVNGCG